MTDIKSFLFLRMFIILTGDLNAVLITKKVPEITLRIQGHVKMAWFGFEADLFGAFSTVCYMFVWSFYCFRITRNLQSFLNAYPYRNKCGVKVGIYVKTYA